MSNQPSRPRRQHTIPRFFLSGFCQDGTEIVWRHDKDSPNPIPLSINDASVIKDFYSYEGFDDPEFIEKVLSRVENNSPAAIAELIAGTPLTPLQREHVALFVGTMYARMPAFREYFEIMLGEAELGKAYDARGNPAAFAEAARLLQLRTGVRVNTPEELFKVAMGKKRPRYNQVGSLQGLLSMTSSLSRILINLHWRVLEVSGQTDLATSDSPVLYCDYSKGEDERFECEFGGRSVIIQMALDRKHLLECAQNLSYKSREFGEVEVIEVNRMTALGASRYVYSSSKNHSVGQLVQEYKGETVGFKQMLRTASDGAVESYCPRRRHPRHET